MADNTGVDNIAGADDRADHVDVVNDVDGAQAPPPRPLSLPKFPETRNHYDRRHWMSSMGRISKWMAGRPEEPQPSVVLLYMGKGGQVQFHGPEHMRPFVDDYHVDQAFKRCAVNQPFSFAGVARPESGPEILSIIPIRHMRRGYLRTLVPDIVDRDGKRPYIAENTPGWWPPGLRFTPATCDGAEGKMLQADEMRKVVKCWMSHHPDEFTTCHVSNVSEEGHASTTDTAPQSTVQRGRPELENNFTAVELVSPLPSTSRVTVRKRKQGNLHMHRLTTNSPLPPISDSFINATTTTPSTTRHTTPSTTTSHQTTTPSTTRHTSTPSTTHHTSPSTTIRTTIRTTTSHQTTTPSTRHTTTLSTTSPSTTRQTTTTRLSTTPSTTTPTRHIPSTTTPTRHIPSTTTPTRHIPSTTTPTRHIPSTPTRHTTTITSTATPSTATPSTATPSTTTPSTTTRSTTTPSTTTPSTTRPRTVSAIYRTTNSATSSTFQSAPRHVFRSPAIHLAALRASPPLCAPRRVAPVRTPPYTVRTTISCTIPTIVPSSRPIIVSCTSNSIATVAAPSTVSSTITVASHSVPSTNPPQRVHSIHTHCTVFRPTKKRKLP